MNPHLATPALRVAAMAGKFLFILYAARSLSAQDFGRFGLVAAGTWIGVLFCGLEVHAILMRDLVVAARPQARVIRGTYLTYAVLAGSIFGAIGCGLAYLLTWNVALLVGLICFFEYLGQEATRLLAADSFPIRSALSTFLRSGAWCYLIVGFTLLGVAPQQWSLEMVLGAWLLASITAVMLLWAERGQVELGTRSLERLWEILPRTLSLSWRFMVSAVGIQVILTGSRFFLAGFQSEEVSGRYTLLSTLASISLIMVKGVCEPIYFPRVLGPNGSEHWRSFRRSVLAVVVLSTLASTLVTPVYSMLSAVSFAPEETPALVLLLLAYAAMGASVVPHFRLFSRHEDSAILSATVRAAVIFLGLSAVLVPRLSLLGSTIAALAGALWLYGDKAVAAHIATRRSL